MKFTTDISFKGSKGNTCHYEEEVCGKLMWVPKIWVKKKSQMDSLWKCLATISKLAFPNRRKKINEVSHSSVQHLQANSKYYRSIKFYLIKHHMHLSGSSLSTWWPAQ